jgi:hypothetical protein
MNPIVMNAAGRAQDVERWRMTKKKNATARSVPETEGVPCIV